MPWVQERLNKDGKPHYRVFIRLKGYKPVTKTFRRKTDAERWAKETEVGIRQGRFFKTREAQKHTFKELVERYSVDHLPRKVRSKQESIIKYWKNALGHHLLSDISTALVLEWRDKLASEITFRKRLRSPSTVVRYLAALSHIFTVAMKEYGWVEENPVSKIIKPKEPRGRIRFLDEEERKNLLDACKNDPHPYLYTIVVLALSTGMRQGEIMNLKWQDIDLEKGRIILHATKNDERRVLPLMGHALELLKAAFQKRLVPSSLLFPNKKGDRPICIRSVWEKALKTANIRDFRFHDLRHTAASYLLMNGASSAEIAEILGHKTLQMVKRYAHLSELHTAGVVGRMNERIFG